MLVKELIAQLQALHRPDAEVCIASHSTKYCFDDVTKIESEDVVYLLGNNPDGAHK